MARIGLSRSARPQTPHAPGAGRGAVSGAVGEAAAIAMRLGWVCRAINGALPQDPGQTHTRLKMFLDGKP